MVTNLDPRIEYLSDGSELQFQIDLAVAKINPTQIRCWTEDRVAEYPVRVILAEGTDYTFYYDEDSVPFVEMLAPITAGLYLVIQSALPYGQSTDYIEGDLMNPEVLESDLDRLHILGLQSLDDLSKAIRAAYDDPLDPIDFFIPYPEQRANKYLFFDPDGKVTVSRIQGQGMRWGDGTSYELDELIEDEGILYKCLVALSTPGLRPSLTPAEWVYYNSRSSEAVSGDATITPPIDEHTVYCDTGVNPITLTIEDSVGDDTIINLVIFGEFPVYINSTGIQAFASDSVCIIWDGTEWAVKSDAGNRAVVNINSNATIPSGTRNTRIYVDASANTVLVLLDDAIEQDDRVAFIVLDDTYEVRVQGAELDLPVNEATEFAWTGNKWVLVSSSAGSTSVLSVDFLIGSFYPFGGPVANIPEGMMPCLGQSLNPLDEPKLFDKIGTTYGGDGITTFMLPDLQGIGVRGVGTQDVHGALKGSSLNIGEIWEDEIGPISASFSGTALATHNHTGSFSGTNATGSLSAGFDVGLINNDDSPGIATGVFSRGTGRGYSIEWRSPNGSDINFSMTPSGTVGVGVASAGTPSGSVSVNNSGSETHATDLIVQWLIFTGSVYTGPSPHNFPIGTISMFDANTPALIDGVTVTSGIAGEWEDNVTLPGWYACVDGNQSRGCQDLVDRFIMGKVIAGSGVIDGANSKLIDIENIPTHAHSCGNQSVDHNHSVPGSAHSHLERVYTAQASGGYKPVGFSDTFGGPFDSSPATYTASATPPAVTSGGISLDHNHAIGNTGGGIAFDVTPAKYSAIFIRKCL